MSLTRLSTPGEIASNIVQRCKREKREPSFLEVLLVTAKLFAVNLSKIAIPITGDIAIHRQMREMQKDSDPLMKIPAYIAEYGVYVFKYTYLYNNLIRPLL